MYPHTDPVLETVSRDAAIIKELGWTLKYGINTHCHADHITGTGELKKIFPKMKSMISKLSTAKADILLEEGDKIEFGGRFLTAISTPGHTLGCTSYVMDDNSMVFTGDTLMIRGKAGTATAHVVILPHYLDLVHKYTHTCLRIFIHLNIYNVYSTYDADTLAHIYYSPVLIHACGIA